MTLLLFKQNFHKTLASHYPKTELDSFFKLILEDTLQLSKIDFALNPNQLLTTNQTTVLEEITKGLTTYIPIQYLIGHTEFMDLKFKVNADVLIPRPETEELIRWIIEDFKDIKKPQILDIGTGSGCIPICLTKNLPTANTSTIDVSKKAIHIAKQNAIDNQVSIEFLHQDILTTHRLDKKYDVIVSNPPYVRNLEKKEMHQNVLDHEPHLALFVEDNNPLIFYKQIAILAKNNLKPNGALYYEINQYLGSETVNLLRDIGFKNIELKKDLFGQDRMVKAYL